MGRNTDSKQKKQINRYAKGARYERHVLAEFLSREDVIYATRTPGSKSKADLVVIMRNPQGHIPLILFVQCKNQRKSAPLASYEVDTLKHLRSTGIGVVYMVKQQPHEAPRSQLMSIEEAEAYFGVRHIRSTVQRREKPDDGQAPITR